MKQAQLVRIKLALRYHFCKQPETVGFAIPAEMFTLLPVNIPAIAKCILEVGLGVSMGRPWSKHDKFCSSKPSDFFKGVFEDLTTQDANWVAFNQFSSLSPS